ncbi:efflux RND transporter permease subunit [Sphingomonas sp. MA1305]|jgi:cobalt-zinc-cadmium resistance protein CzcA|uniref:efflux RND transporter permease subunit n=1 Tax=unclassified Sphingomonas TaxID=196159 RepID=UPI0018DF216F|nr:MULTISPECIES: CusA/CzcA family heavy metal efflux RND transporter [unclassified Sphingomonas]MBI0476981.1 efflux RND transporter permease subunit [Sphingomonas sp. MA1305]MCP4025519.1 efflux RND transporter permease subunit [Sphingomonas sp.]
MIAWLIDWVTRRRFAVALVSALVAVVGIWLFASLQIDAIPDITGVQVQINTAVPALAPEDTEKLVTLPIERAMGGQPGLDSMRSLTKTGLSQVTLLYKDGTDQLRARQLVTERLNAVQSQLPAGSTPQLAPITTGLGEIYYYTLEWRRPPAGMDPQRQLMELYEAQEYTVRPMLRAVEGVADVNSNGGLEQQFVVEPDPARLTAHGVTAAELADAVGKNVENAGGGIISRGARRFTVRTNARVMNATEIGAIPVKFAGGVLPLTVRDLATVVIGSAPRQGAATQNGHEAVLGTVMMLVGQNSRQVALRVEEAMPGIQGALPKGMVLHQQYSRSDLVERTIKTVEHNLGEGALLVALVLLVVMGNWRAALIVALVIPLAFLVTVGGMHVIGLSGNLMSLGALDFGLIVDGSIVVVENGLRLLAERRQEKGEPLDAEERRATVAEAARMVARPTLFGIAIIGLVYVPVLSLGGVEGKLFQPMAEAVMLAIAAGLAWTFTIVPALSAWLLREPESEDDDGRRKGVIGYAERAYGPALERAIAHPYLLAVAAIVLMVATFGVFKTLGSQFTPKLDEGSMTVMVYKPVGLSLERSLQIEQETERAIRRAYPQITHTFSRIGTSEVATDPMPPNENDLYIFYAPEKDWPTGDGKPTTKGELSAGIENVAHHVYQQQTLEFAQPIEMRFNEMLEGVRADVSVKVFGENYDILERIAKQAKAVLQKQPGTAGVEFETAGRPESIVVELDRAALLRLGLGASEVNKAITDALAGAEVGFIPEGAARHAVVIRMPEALRADPSAILALPLRVGDYGMVPLSRVARLRQTPAVEPILHDDGKRRAALMVNLVTSDLAGYVAKAQQAINAQVKRPPGYRIEFGGQFHQLEAAQKRLSIVVPAALLLIFLLVYAALGSMKEAAIVYTAIPFAVTGGVLALWLRGLPFSITAAIGFIALSGIAMLNGLVLVDHINSLRDGRDGGERLQPDEAVRRGAHDRLRPVLSTALVASVGFVPMAIATGAGAEVQRPLATVVIGGVVTSTLLTLLVLPSLYRLVAELGRGRSGGTDQATAT